MDFSANHLGFVFASYGLTLVCLVALVLQVLMKDRKLRAEAERLEGLLDDGELVIIVSRARGYLRRFAYVARLRRGKHHLMREVDEELRRDQLKKLWDKYSILIIAVMVLIVAAVGGWRGYEYLENKKAAEAGASAGFASSFLPQPTNTAADTAVKAATCSQRRLIKLVIQKSLFKRTSKKSEQIINWGKMVSPTRRACLP